MDPERYQRIQALLQAALEREPAERVSFLAEACAGDESMRRQIESLLVSSEEVGSFLESPAAQIGAPLISDPAVNFTPGLVLGPYTILSQSGRANVELNVAAAQLKDFIKLKRVVWHRWRLRIAKLQA